MDFRESIIAILGIQDVDVSDLKLFKKDLRLEIKVRQRRSECFCIHYGMQFDQVKEWQLRRLKGPPMGVYQEVTIKFMQMRGFCLPCGRTSVKLAGASPAASRAQGEERPLRRLQAFIGMFLNVSSHHCRSHPITHGAHEVTCPHNFPDQSFPLK